MKRKILSYKEILYSFGKKNNKEELKMKKKNLTMTALVLACIMAFTACATKKEETPTPTPTATEKPSKQEETSSDVTEPAAAAGEKHVIKIGDSQPETSAVGTYIKRFGEIVEEKSAGRITVEFYPGAMMGNGTQSMQQVQMGSLDMYRCDASALYDFGIESMKLPNIPYMFASKEHANKVLYGEIGTSMLEDVTSADIGFVGIGWLIETGRSMFTRDTKVTKLEDAKGLKIRSVEAGINIDTKAALGMNPTPLAFSEVYTSLSTGVIDAAANTLDSFVSNKLYEACDYFINSEQMFNSCPVVFSSINWAKYSKEDQQLIIDSWQASMNEFDVFVKNNDAKNIEICEKNGVEICDLEDKDKWVEAVAPVWEKYGVGYEDMIAKIQAMK